MDVESWALFLFVVMNLVAFGTMAWDKVRSRQDGAERISEGCLFFLATMFGSVGVFLGMLVFHHKTQKWYFLIGIPMLILENIATLFFLARQF